MRARWLGLLVFGVCFGATQAALADDACMDGAKTELEQLYCKTVAEGQGAGLPSPTDFKRNDPRVQALLLRRPAGRIGLDVPDPGASATTEPPRSDDGPAPAGSQDIPAQQGDEPEPTGRLAECRLEGQRITCPQRRYELMENLPNNRLADGALAPENRLGLSPFEGNRNDEEAVRRYLSDAYDRYIPNM
ncbi:MAG: hypothetical protein ABJO43_05200, partial [Marinobacter sp.]